MKKEFPFDNLYEVMLQYLAPLYFPQSFDDDTIHTLAREEFFRVQGIICREYEFDEDKYIEEYNGFSPFDEVSDDIEQEVYARIRKDSRLLQIVRIRKETIALIREAVKKANGIIGTFYTNRGIRYRDANIEEEYQNSPIVAICNTVNGCYGGYEGNTVYDLFINEKSELLCTLNGEAGEDFDEPIENVQVEGLIILVHWLLEHGFLTSDEVRCKGL
ncbi:hypothetical protein [Parabacteroides distasonis]|jgi:hypothetical protein|uniref:hypothetical protein n=1 Tax=Bacteroidales TaxID=171549 RepID=UPI00321C0519